MGRSSTGSLFADLFVLALSLFLLESTAALSWFRFFVVVECIDQVAPFWVCGCPFSPGHIQSAKRDGASRIVSSSLLLYHFFAFGPFGANDDPSWALTDGDVAVRFVLVQTIVGVVECSKGNCRVPADVIVV
jgi:hypothetical protein